MHLWKYSFAVALLVSGCQLSKETDLKYLEVDVLSAGHGELLQQGQKVAVYFDAWLFDKEKKDQKGMLLDSNRQRRQPVEFILGKNAPFKVWNEALKQKRRGDRVLVRVPAEMAFGQNAPRPDIPAHSALIFELEILEKM